MLLNFFYHRAFFLRVIVKTTLQADEQVYRIDYQYDKLAGLQQIKETGSLLSFGFLVPPKQPTYIFWIIYNALYS